MTPIISTTNLVKHYPGIVAGDGINLAVPQGKRSRGQENLQGWLTKPDVTLLEQSRLRALTMVAIV